jgi:hypothetical protein
MLRVVVGLAWAGLVFAYFMLVMPLSLPEGRFAGEAQDLLLILGGGIAVIFLLHTLTGARDERHLRACEQKMKEQDRLTRERSRASALRLNTCGSGDASARGAQIIPFPARHRRIRRPALGRLGLVEA